MKGTLLIGNQFKHPFWEEGEGVISVEWLTTIQSIPIGVPIEYWYQKKTPGLKIKIQVKIYRGKSWILSNKMEVKLVLSNITNNTKEEMLLIYLVISKIIIPLNNQIGNLQNCENFKKTIY